jgi:hypothetical protein
VLEHGLNSTGPPVKAGAWACESALAADSTAAEEFTHAGVLENWVPAFMVEIEPGSAAAQRNTPTPARETKAGRPLLMTKTRRPAL